MTRCFFLHMQDQWELQVPRVPIEGEVITLDRIGNPDPVNEPTFKVSVVHWYLDEAGEALVPYVSLQSMRPWVTR